MNQAAYDAIAEAWEMTQWVRSIFPSTHDPEVMFSGIESPSWYKGRGIGGRVTFFKPIKGQMLNNIGKFVNEGFVIYMWSILQEYNVVPDDKEPDLNIDGGEHVQLTKWLRHRFSHGLKYDAEKRYHPETRALFERLFPKLAKTTTGFPTSIDTVLPTLTEKVLAYIRAAT